MSLLIERRQMAGSFTAHPTPGSPEIGAIRILRQDEGKNIVISVELAVSCPSHGDRKGTPPVTDHGVYCEKTLRARSWVLAFSQTLGPPVIWTNSFIAWVKYAVV